MIDGSVVVAALEATELTHLIWVPDSHLGTWESALSGSRLAPVRPCREGEAVGIAAGLMLGGASPLVVMQCTGFFEAGDAVRNVVHDLKLPLKMIVGVRGWSAHLAGKTADNCPRYAERLVAAWDLPFQWFHPDPDDTGDQLPSALNWLTAGAVSRTILWSE